MAADPATELVERVQELTARLDEAPDTQTRALADDLVASVIQLYGVGLERIFAALDLPGASAEQARDMLVEDGIVASLLLIHGLYPVALETRVREALDSVRPYMESHGGDVEIVSVQDGVAHLRLVGHCKGCPASEATLELAIKRALEEVAPDLEGLEVEGVRDREVPAGGFELPLVRHGEANGNGKQNGAAAHPWTDFEQAAPGPGKTVTATVAGADLLVANVGGTLLAYRNECGWCRGRLDAAAMTPSGTLTCPSCDRRFELRRAGRSPDDDVLQVEPVPLLRGEGRVRVAVPA